jgi:PAS domain S-box-containing protein
MSEHHSDERYRALFSSIDEGFCVVEVLFDDHGRPADYRFLEINPAFERHTGLVGAAGRRMRELAPAHEQHWFDTYGRVALTGQPVRFVNEAKALGGRWFDVNAFRVGPPERRQVGILFMDITDRKRVEAERDRLHAALVNERARLAAVVEQAPAFICTLRGPEHVFEFANERYYEIAGRRDIIGKAVRQAQPEVEAQGYLEILDRVYRTGESFEAKEKSLLLRRGGKDQALEQRFINVAWQALREVDGTISGVFIHGVDVTELVGSREALRASEERYRRLVETAHEGIWTIDADGRTTYVNQRMADLLGHAPQEMMGRVHTDFMWEHDRPKGDVDMERRRQGTAQVWDQRYRRKDGSELWTVASCNTLYDAEGKFAGALGMFTDITVRKRAEAERQALLDGERAAREEAESANRAKDRFLAVLSHELRTPLTPVALTAAAMEMDPNLPYEFREDVAMMRRNVELETRLIDDLLDLSRVTSGKLRLNRQPTHVHRLIRHVLETVGPELHEKQLKIERELAAAHDRVEADPARLQQTLWNLLKNAAKFTPSGGRVSIRTSNEAGRLVIEVRDSGKGIPRDVLPRIFDPFEQGAADVTRRYGGMGLGLAIAKAVVDLHGGTIGAASGGDGKGAMFTVSLPLGAIPSPVPQTGGNQPTDDRTRPLRLLVVEDHSDTAKTLVRLLRLDGAEVQWASTVAGAIELAASEPFDVVVSDLGLPDGSGHDLMRRLRRDRPVPGIAMSGYGMEDDLRQSREAGFVEHLVKPVSLPQLREAIRRVANARIS